MSEWRPIEEAPKDGTRILVYGKRYERINERDGPGPIQVAYWQKAGDTGFWLTRANISCDHVTHFMPLPPPPKVTP